MAKDKMSVWDWVAIVLLMIAGLNWGLYGFFDVNLVEIVAMGYTFIAKFIYGAVTASVFYSTWKLFLD